MPRSIHDDAAMYCQMEKEEELAVGLVEKPRRTPTLAEQYARFIPVQVTHPQFNHIIAESLDLNCACLSR